MTDDDPPAFLIGGMDAGIEALLLSAGGVWLVAPPPPDPPGPWIELVFAPDRRRAAEAALRACGDHGWPLTEGGARGSVTTVSVQEVVAHRLLGQLTRERAAPDAVVVRAADLTPAQLRGLLDALSVDSSLSFTDR